MTAVERILPLLSGVRPRGQDKYSALCPAHEDRTPSLSIRRTSDRVLVTCWAACSVGTIVAALGLQMADLFDGGRQTIDPLAQSRRDAAEGFRAWRSGETLRLADELQRRDAEVAAIDRKAAAGELSIENAFSLLAETYDGYTWLAHTFERLRVGTDAEAMEIFRNE